MAEVKLSKKVFEKFLKQLVTIEEEKESWSKYPVSGKNRDEFVKMMDLYERRLKELVESADKIETDDASVPFVAIGSEVEVYDLDCLETVVYRVMPPETFEAGGNDVTLLSPIGKALLLKEVGDSVDIRVPAGIIHYEVRSINLNSEIDIKSVFSYLG